MVPAELLGSEVIVHVTIFDARQPGIGLDGDRYGTVSREVAQRFTHLGGSGSAVHSDDVRS